ncbi:acyl-CoA carboxylase subunit epsilon [Naasia sp. SYSU D00948]|uniref:acyl-CoA carboxylase subunit epsilon n=1 Tax=Naasia sp. SYSU D00948 TaxID=2817379 RepID=UPI001B302F79|nr:acyl-CoA carboxylase subunit epsilon [Naasia sp. SYSU D00948]
MTPDPAPQDGDAEAADLGVRIVRGSPTPEELAAVLAVLHALPAPPAHRPAPPSATPSDWQRSQRALRTAPLRHPWR